MKGQEKLLFVEENRVKGSKYLENLWAKFSSLLGYGRPGSGGNVDILQCEIAFENNEGMLETFGSDCKNCWEKFSKFAKRRKSSRFLQETTEHAHTKLSISAQCKRKLSYCSEADLNRMWIRSYPTLYLSDSHPLCVNRALNTLIIFSPTRIQTIVRFDLFCSRPTPRWRRKNSWQSRQDWSMHKFLIGKSRCLFLIKCGLFIKMATGCESQRWGTLADPRPGRGHGDEWIDCVSAAWGPVLILSKIIFYCRSLCQWSLGMDTKCAPSSCGRCHLKTGRNHWGLSFFRAWHVAIDHRSSISIAGPGIVLVTCTVNPKNFFFVVLVSAVLHFTSFPFSFFSPV